MDARSYSPENNTPKTIKRGGISPKVFHLNLQRRSFILILIFAFCFLAFVFSNSNYRVSVPHVASFLREAFIPSTLKPGYLIDTVGCQMPDFDPYHPSVAKFIKPWSHFCVGKKSFILVSTNATLRLDRNQLLRDHRINPKNLKCSYRSILRNSKNDGYIFGPERSLVFNTFLGVDAVHVKCFYKSKLIHEVFLPLIPIKTNIESRCNQATFEHLSNESKLNIIIIGVDSISKLNFIRHFKKTRNYLLNVLKAIELKGYNKVGDNTYPNLVPMLTGNMVNENYTKRYHNGPFDDVDLIWKRYGQLGYRTLMAEDAPDIALFNYHRKGFVKQPSDYYFRPFAAAVEKSKWKSKSTRFCFQSKLEIRVLYDYLLNFLETLKDRPVFGFAFAARLTHDELNAAAVADGPVYDTLKKIVDLGYRNNSLVIFMSDHGLRFGPIRKTFVGRFEEHWPVMFLSFPTWFADKYPDEYKNLLTNQRRLTIPLDIHETLLDLLNLTRRKTDDKHLKIGIGISLFDEIPPERTCEDAGIDPHWCTCQSLIPADLRSPEVQEGASKIVVAINNWLSPERDYCVNLTVKEVVSAHVTSTTDEALTGKDIKLKTVFKGVNNVQTDYLIVVQVAPSDALFEATVRYSRNDGSYSVLGDVSRLNAYGNQSSCVFDAWLQKFCFCKEGMKIA